MSYLLDSLKKSDSERKNNSFATKAMEQVIHSAQQEECEASDNVVPSYVLFVVFLVLLILGFYIGWSYSGTSLTKLVANENNIDTMLHSASTTTNSVVTKDIAKEPAMPLEAMQEVTNAVSARPLLDNALLESASSEHTLLKTPPPQNGDSLNESTAVKEVVDSDTQRLYKQAADPRRLPEVNQLYQQKAAGIAVASVSDKPETVVINNAGKTSVVQPVSEKVNLVAQISQRLPSIYELDLSLKETIPSIQYDTHVYASDNKSGFVILNGQKKYMGDQLINDVYIERVNKDDVVLSYQGVIFTLPAMKSWTNNQ